MEKMERRLHAAKFEEMIAFRGRNVHWHEAVICSCWSLDSGQPDFYCKACNGTGYVYRDPVVSKGLLMSIAFNKDFHEFSGAFEVGDAILTVPKLVPRIINGRASADPTKQDPNPMFNIGMHDLITVMDDDWKFSEVLVKGTALPKRPADTLLNIDITRVHSIQVVDKVAGTVAYYQPDVDFTMTGNKVVWLPGKGPDDGTQYGIVYGHRPTFTVLAQLPEPRHQDDQDLPKRVALRFRAGGFTKVQNG